MAKFEFKKPIWSAVIITAVLLAVNYIMSFLNYPVQSLYSSVGPVTAISGTLGSKVLGWIGGIIPIGNFLGMGIVAVLISAYLILLVGDYLVQLGLPVAKGKVGLLTSKILYGTAVFYLLIVGLVMKSWGIWLGLLIHTLIVAFIASYAAEKLNVSM